MVCTSGIQHNRNLEPNENGISQGSMVGRCMVSRTTPKHTALVWIAVHNNRLSTGDRMLKWNPHAITKCWLLMILWRPGTTCSSHARIQKKCGAKLFKTSLGVDTLTSGISYYQSQAPPVLAALLVKVSISLFLSTQTMH